MEDVLNPTKSFDPSECETKVNVCSDAQSLFQYRMIRKSVLPAPVASRIEL